MILRRCLLFWGVTLLLAGSVAAQEPGNPTRRAALERQLLVHPAEAVIYLELAREYEVAKQPDAAEQVLRRGIDQATDTDRVRATLVDLLARQERWSDALAAVEPLRRDFTGRAVAAKLRVNAGLVAYQVGDRTGARRHWDQALRDDPALVEAAVNLGALLIEIGARDSARAVAAGALRLHPDDPRLLALRAGTLEGAEGVAAAITALRQLRATRPRDEGIGLELARLLAATGDHAAAAALYDTLVRAPGATEAALEAAVTFRLDVSQFDAAAITAEDAVGRFPRSGALWSLLGEAEAGRGRWRDALVAYRRAVVLLPDPSEAELALADASAADGDTAAAQEALDALGRRAAPRDAVLRAAHRAQLLGADSLAADLYGVLLARAPDDVTALTAAAELAEARGDTGRAVALYRTAAASDSSGPAPQLALLRLTHPAPDTATLLLRRAVWRGMEAVQHLELQTAQAVSGDVSRRRVVRAQPLFDRRQRTLDQLRAALDTVVFQTDWGETELASLKLAYPQSTLLDRYEAGLAMRQRRDSLALARYEALLRRDPTDAELQRTRAAVLDQMGRQRDAATAYARALELAPEDESTFRALVRLRQESGTLEQLLVQLRRFRVALPDSDTLAEREIEVLHRLGRTAEAEAVARTRRERMS
ncbi:MAG: tetratricopeptide repeat protein [Gemmatimonadota bacterium]|nr:tetratricopeptide repeat protein [Gemmatimonadota bacterium]